MKKVLVLILSVLMVSMLVVTTVSAGSKKLLDCRELEEYGQQHYYLGAPISVRPDVEDATVSENEYSLSYEFKKGDKTVFIENGTDVCNEWARVYVAYDEQNIYLAMQTKDTDYVKGKDGVSFNLNFKDRGHPYETITRMCFDLYQHKEAEEDDISTFTTRCRFLLKNEKGEWENLPSVEGMEYITDISGKYDEKTQVFTVELEMYLKPVLRFWNNELDLKDIRLSMIPFVWMYGSPEGSSTEPVNQGIMWNYLPLKDQTLKSKFLSQYSYSPPWLANIVHFCEDPKYTTQSPVTTASTTVADITTAAVTTEPSVTSIEAQTTDATQKTSGCGATLALSAIPMMALTFVCVIKRKNDE